MNNEETGINMTDKDYLTSILELEKNISNNYSIAMNEASNEDLYEDFFDMFTNIKDMARDIYNIMDNYGWYKLEYVKDNEIIKKINCFNEKLDNLDE